MEDSPRRVGGLTEIQIERALLGELPAAQLQSALAAMDADVALGARRDALASSNRDILDRYPVGPAAEAIRRRAEAAGRIASAPSAEPRRALGWWIPALAGAAAMLVAALLVAEIGGERGNTGPEAPVEVTRDKGLEPSLRIYRKTPQGAERLEPGQPARGGDVLQIGYVAVGRGHGVILSIDGAGAVTVHAPSDARSPTRLQAGGEVQLAHAYKLDDAPGFERFFFLTSGEALDVEAIVVAAEALARDAGRAERDPIALPGSVEQSSFIIRKVGP